MALVAGCGKGDESIARKAGSKVGETITDFATGMGKGIDRKMNVRVELSETVTGSGLSNTVAKLDSLIANNNLSVYLISTRPYKGKLIAKALNADGQEIGRATAEIDLGENDAKYFLFPFHKEMDSQLATRYTIDVVK